MTNYKPAQQDDNFVKVRLPGEWPWVYRMKEEGDTLIGRLDNRPVNTFQHGYEINDVIRFQWEESPPGSRLYCWEAKEKLTLKAME